MGGTAEHLKKYQWKKGQCGAPNAPSLGGYARAKKIRERKELKKVVQDLLDSEFNYDGKKISGAELIATKQFERAIEKADTKAFEVLRDTAGQKPSNKIEVTQAENPFSGLSVDELKKAAGLDESNADK